VIIAVAAQLPSAVHQRAVLNDEIRRGARRHFDRKGRRPSPSGMSQSQIASTRSATAAEGRMLLEKPSGTMCSPPHLCGCSSSCESPIGCPDTTRKAPCCSKSRREPPKPTATPHNVWALHGLAECLQQRHEVEELGVVQRKLVRAQDRWPTVPPESMLLLTPFSSRSIPADSHSRLPRMRRLKCS
jgi:hypothetical protein